MLNAGEARNEPFFAHPQALVESESIGPGTRVWAFAHVLAGAVIGADCNICDGVFVEADVVVGDRVTVKCGVQLWDGVRLEDDVFVGPNATFTNDPFPRSRARPARFATTVVRRGASIGANATILPGITVGERAMVGAGAVVTKDVAPGAIVVGNPARVVGSVDEPKRAADGARRPAPDDCGVNDASLVRLRQVAEAERGTTTIGEVGEQIGFVPQRFFLVADVPSGARRGAHAHRRLRELLVCVRGACTVELDDGRRRTSVRLDQPDLGVDIGPVVWRTHTDHTPDALLLVLASDHYDPSDYIWSYDDFLALARG